MTRLRFIAVSTCRAIRWMVFDQFFDAQTITSEKPYPFAVGDLKINLIGPFQRSEAKIISVQHSIDRSVATSMHTKFMVPVAKAKSPPDRRAAAQLPVWSAPGRKGIDPIAKNDVKRLHQAEVRPRRWLRQAGNPHRLRH